MDLLWYCQKFRKAIETCNKNKLSVAFLAFPRGSCGDSSLLLARFLKEEGLGEFDYICGSRDSETHAWLKQGDTIIDITSDQFSDGLGRIYIGSKNAFHSSFEVNRLSSAHEEYDEDAMKALNDNYEEIMLNVVNC